MRLYETMFLVDNGRAKDDLDGILAELGEMVARAGGEMVNIGKWDERKLTYEIKHQRRATYVLAHWNGPPDGPARRIICPASIVALTFLRTRRMPS